MPSLISTELLHKYNVAGPRYTSYPTAVQFHDGVDGKNYPAILQQVQSTANPLSLYVHVPYCESLCYYCGCHKVVTKASDRTDAYLQALIAEIGLQGQWANTERAVTQIHFGGGTPTFYSPAQLAQVLSAIHTAFTLNKPECSIEIDPRTTSIDDIGQLVDLGFNRMSFGIQDFDEQVQTAINRVQCATHTAQLIDKARDCGVQSISVDLVYGLPHQTPERFKQTLDWVNEVKPNRVALYSYAHMPALIKAQKLIASSTLPSAKTKLSLFHDAADYMIDKGYVHIGMDHFALPNDSLAQALATDSLQRNFMGYSTQANCDMLAIGASAIGKLGDAFVQNYKTVSTYIAAIEKAEPAIERGYIRTNDDKIRAQIINQVMCKQTVDIGKIEEQFKINFDEYFYTAQQQLAALEEQGLIKRLPGTLQITDVGRVLVRNIAMAFDAYLNQDNGARLRFSKAI